MTYIRISNDQLNQLIKHEAISVKMNGQATQLTLTCPRRDDEVFIHWTDAQGVEHKQLIVQMIPSPADGSVAIIANQDPNLAIMEL